MTIQIESIESLTEKSHIESVDIPEALFWNKQSKHFDLFFLNARKGAAINAPLVRSTTRYGQTGAVAPDGRQVTSGNSTGASQAFRNVLEAFRNNDNIEDFVAVCYDICAPSKTALAMATIARLEGLQSEHCQQVLGEQEGKAFHKLMNAIVDFTLEITRLDRDKLPKPKRRNKKSLDDNEAKAEDAGPLTEIERRRKRLAEMRGEEIPEDIKAKLAATQQEEQQEEDTEDTEQASFDESELVKLTDVKYIGTSTAEKLLADGWTLDQINVQYKLHGELPPEVQEIVSAKAADNLKKEIE
jgi:hypothetical protein